MDLTWVTSVSRWVLPLLALAIVIYCGAALGQNTKKNSVIGYLVNSANGDRIPLKFFETSIGRSPICDIVLNYNTVSRFHAVIVKRQGKWILFDTYSKTGTMVNKDRIIRKKYLENGDVIIFGNAIFRFFDDIPTDYRSGSGGAYAKPKATKDTFAQDASQPPAAVIPQMVKESRKLVNMVTGEVMKIDNMREVCIGRASDCDIRINRTAVSPYHTLLLPTGHGKWTVEDMESEEGTLLNGVPVMAPTPLYDGDIIEICGYTIKFTDPYAE